MPQRSVNLRYFAILREQRGLAHENLTTDAATLGDLYNKLATIYPFTLPADKIGAAINNRFSTMEAPIKEGDTIVFIPPVAGG